MNTYLFILKPKIDGPVVDSWYKVAEPGETKATLFAMIVRAKMNMSIGPLVVKSEDEWTADLLESYVRALSRPDLAKFIEESSLAGVPALPVAHPKVKTGPW